MRSPKTPGPDEAEQQFRELIDAGDLPQPDRVDYHASRRELMFHWDTQEVVVVVELDEEPGEPEDIAA